MTIAFLEPPDASNDGPAVRPLVSETRAKVVLGSLLLVALAILGKAVQLQLLEGSRWSQVAERQQVKERNVAPPRGRILDATGTVLVETRELMQLNITPRDLRKNRRFANPRATLRAGLKALGVHDTLIKRALDTARHSVLLPATYLPSDVDRFAGVPGVWRERVLRRLVSAPPGIRNVLGEVNSLDVPKGGIEQELDSLLRGVSGRNALLSDGRGNLVETPQRAGVAARPGHSITLTLNKSLQEIAERELSLAMRRTGASGGDVVMLDPRDGAVLVLAGARNRMPSLTSTALTEPYESGSVMKPFLVARLLEEKRARVDEMINTENGTYTFANRTIGDEHKASAMAVRDVIRLSSNIGVVKLAQRFSPREEYETMRDFGFGSLTGVPFPAESRGRLTTPRSWDAMSPASIAMGYEISVTPLQLAAAYAALANGGELLQPVLIREIHDPDGALVYQHKRRVVRRVLTEQTTRTMRTMLQSVVDSGTAMAADLSTYDVAGKSGTARRAVGRVYSGGRYNSTFAGMFPAQAPQYVVVARLIDPQGKIYGGTVSGGMVNGILQAALATRDASLDRTALAAVAKPLVAPARPPRTAQQLLAAARDSMRFDSLRAPVPAPVEPLAEAARMVVSLPLTRPTSAVGKRDKQPLTPSIPSPLWGEPHAVPTVYGLDLRQAVRTLHAAGFQVRIVKGADGRTRPASGALLRRGSTVVLESHL